MAGLFAARTTRALGDGTEFSFIRSEESQDTICLTQVNMFENDRIDGVTSLITHIRDFSQRLDQTGASPAHREGSPFGGPCLKTKKRRDRITSPMKATSGFEPLVQLLQSRALPLGDVALNGKLETGIEPATFSLARRCSTTEPL